MFLPTSGSADDVLQMIEGRLTEMGKKPLHVQALVLNAGENNCEHLQL